MNTLACFQHFMEICQGEYRDNVAIPYLDELLVFSKSFDDHLNHVKLVLQRLKQHEVKIKANNCHLFKREFQEE